MKYLPWIIVLLTLSACSHEPGEPRREPGALLRPGGDVVIENH